MANKFWKNAGDALSNLIPSSKPAAPADQKQKAKEEITESFHNEQKMLTKLNQVLNNLENPKKALSNQKIQELNIAGVVKYAAGELKYPLISETNLKNLDNSMKFIIDGLNSAVMDGLEMTAEWACTALVFAVKNLRTEVPGINADHADALWECRVQYAINLELLIKSCIERDNLVQELAEQKNRRAKERAELDQRKSHYQSRRDSGVLDNAIAMLTQEAHNPKGLSDEAKALKAEIAKLHSLKDSIVEIDALIDTKEVTLRNTEAQIKTQRNILSDPPRVTDPELQNKINEANRRFRDSLRDELNRAEDALRSHNVHISAMKDLLNHSIHIRDNAEALEEIQQMEIEKLKERQYQQQAAAIRARNAANAAYVLENIKVEEPVVETIQEEEPEQEQEVIYEYE